MAGAELDQRGGRDGAFEMQMQLGLGQAANEAFHLRGHTVYRVLANSERWRL